MARDFARAFYKSAAWARCRALVVARARGLCEECLRRGVVRPGRIVHHLVPLTPENVGDPSVTLDPAKLELVCEECHAAAHVELGTYGAPREAERPRVAFDGDGNVVRLGTGGLTDVNR